jgi:phosphoribosylformimino-5-aminoimidazole carboxamide ribotide isomerase
VEIVPVLDLLNGVVVHAVAGQRAEYQPIVSTLVSSTDPVAVAEALLDASQSRVLYVADLNAIQFGCRQTKVWQQLQQLAARRPVHYLLDAGWQQPDDLAHITHRDNVTVVLGTETWGCPDRLSEVVEMWSSDRVMASIDLKAGSLRTAADWAVVPRHAGSAARMEKSASSSHSRSSSLPDEVATLVQRVVQLGIEHVLLLDLASVGVSQGIWLLGWIPALREHFPQVKFWTGGGVRAQEDLQQCADVGLHGVLVGTAWHRGVQLVPLPERTSR